MEDFRISETARQGAAHLCRIRAVASGEMQRLRDRDHRTADDDLVRELRRLTGANPSEVSCAAERLEHGSEVFDDIRIAPRENGERAVARTGFAAGDRGIDIMHVPFAQI